jgi:thioredoxin 1
MPESTQEVEVRSVDASEFDDAVAEYETVLVEFYTEGCSACASMEPVLGNVARATGVPVVLVNPRDPPGLIEEYRVTSVPTLALFRDGEEVARIADGFVGADRLVDFLDEHR